MEFNNYEKIGKILDEIFAGSGKITQDGIEYVNYSIGETIVLVAGYK